MKVAYFGRAGSYAHQIAQRRFGPSKNYLACPTHAQVIDALLARRASIGVLPLENSVAGVVMESIDAMVAPKFVQSRLKIREHLDLVPELALLARKSDPDRSSSFLRRLRRLYSHPYPLRYLSKWIQKNLPRVEIFETVSTAEAALLASEQSESAAIAGPHAAKIYGLDVIVRRLSRAQEYITRFCVISPHSLTKNPCTHAALCFGLHHRAGALVRALSVLAQHNLNLTRILSRPLAHRTGKFEPHTYLFWVDVELGPRQAIFKRALDHLKDVTTFLDVVGVYSIRR